MNNLSYKHKLRFSESHLAVDLIAAQRGLDNVEQSICQPITLPHPSSRLLTCWAYVPATHTWQQLVGECAFLRICLCVCQIHGERKRADWGGKKRQDDRWKKKKAGNKSCVEAEGEREKQILGNLALLPKLNNWKRSIKILATSQSMPWRLTSI